MSAIKLSSDFQISIPKEIREQQGWRAGQEFVFFPSGKSVVLVAIPKCEDLFGIAKGANGENYRDRSDRY